MACRDADWASYVHDKRSTCGSTFFLGSKLVSRLKKKQDSISSSTIEVEYIVATSYCTQLMWTKHTLIDVKEIYDEPIPILCDNSSAIVVQ